MLLDYKDIIIKHCALGMSGREIAEELSVSKSGVNKFLAAFKELSLQKSMSVTVHLHTFAYLTPRSQAPCFTIELLVH